MKTQWRIPIAAVVAVLLLYSITIFVDEAEFAIVTQFGRVVRPLDTAGLHFKLPYQSIIRIDRRLQIYDPRPSEFLTRGRDQDTGHNVNLDVFVCWRVGEPEDFLKTVSDLAGAEPLLHDIVWSELAAEVGRSPLEALVSIDEDTKRLDMVAVADRCAERAEGAYGIEIVDVRIKRISLPSQVRESVFQRMRKERAKMATRYRAEGEGEAIKIRAEADRDRTVTLAKAYAEAEKLRGEGEAKATEIYTQAHQKDPKFYELLRTLEAYKKFLDDKTTILLSADSELLKFLTTGAMLKEQPEQK